MIDPDRIRHTLDLARGVLESLGSDCHGVAYDVADLNGQPALYLRWDPDVHPKTRHDPVQCILLNAVATGRPVSDDKLRRVLTEQIQHMIKVDRHASRELVAVHELSIAEGRDALERELEFRGGH